MAAISYAWGAGFDGAWFDGAGFDLGRLGGDGGAIRADWAAAVAVATDVEHVGADAGGDTPEVTVEAVVEVAPALDGDGRCVRVRFGPRPAPDTVAERCAAGPLQPWEAPDAEVVRLADYFGSIDEHAVEVAGRWVVALSGAVHPDVRRVTAHFADGAQYSFVTLDPGGWFVVVLPDDVADPSREDGRLVNPPVRLELVDAEGTRVATATPPTTDP